MIKIEKMLQTAIKNMQTAKTKYHETDINNLEKRAHWLRLWGFWETAADDYFNQIMGR